MSCMFSLLLPLCSQDPPAPPAQPALHSGCLNMLYCPSHFSAGLTMMCCQTGLCKHIHPIYLEKISQSLVTSASLSSANCDVFKKALANVRTCASISTGHLQLPSPSKALVSPSHWCSSLWCDICSQAERQREKLSLSTVPWEDSSWAEPTLRRAAHIYINKSSTCSS